MLGRDLHNIMEGNMAELHGSVVKACLWCTVDFIVGHTFSRCLLAPPPARVSVDVDVGSKEGEEGLALVVERSCFC